jgi:toprim domain protein
MKPDAPVIIVEGKNDRNRLRRIVSEEIEIICTYGTPGTERLEQLKKQVGERDVFIFTDNDPSGKKIRARLRDAFPDAEQLYTKKGYAGVEGTPEDYMIRQLEKVGLEEYIRIPAEPDAPS